MGLWDRLIDVVGDMIGDTEDVIHHPVYPVHRYVADVDSRLLRGSWPYTGELMRLKTRGVQAVVNLCEERRQDLAVISNGLASFNIPIEDNTAPKLKDVNKLISVIAAFRLTYVHCEAGKGRTGCMVAAYRIRMGWTNAQALAEAERYGLGFPCQKQFIERYVR